MNCFKLITLSVASAAQGQFYTFFIYFLSKRFLKRHLNKDKQTTWIPSIGMVGQLSNDRESQTDFLVDFFKTDEALNAMRIGFMAI